MNVTRITEEHVRVLTDRPFEDVTKAFEKLTHQLLQLSVEHGRYICYLCITELAEQ